MAISCQYAILMPLSHTTYRILIKFGTAGIYSNLRVRGVYNQYVTRSLNTSELYAYAKEKPPKK